MSTEGAGAQRTDGTRVYASGESFKTGSRSKQDRLEAYVDWLLTPEDQRDPRTKREWASLWGVTPQTVRNDIREPFVQRELAARARAVARVDRLPAVLDNLYRLATGGRDLGGREGGTAMPLIPPAAQVSAAKTLMDWMERTAPAREADVNVQDMSSEDLMALALRLLQESDRADANGP